MPVGQLRCLKIPLFRLFSPIFVGLPLLVFGGSHVGNEGLGFVEIDGETDGCVAYSALRARRPNVPEIQAPVAYVDKSREKPTDLFDSMTLFVFLCVFYFDRTERVWFSPHSFKEMMSPNPNNSFDKVMAAIAILALIGFVVSLFKIMG